MLLSYFCGKQLSVSASTSDTIMFVLYILYTVVLQSGTIFRSVRFVSNVIGIICDAEIRAQDVASRISMGIKHPARVRLDSKYRLATFV